MSVFSLVYDRLENPVAIKGMRSRMRNGKAFGVMAAYVSVLGIALYMIMMSSWQMRSGQVMTLDDMSRIGRQAFMTIAMIQLGLVSLVSPALTSGVITLEREQQTLDLLRLTRLTSRDILIGKLVSSLSYLGILIAASIPVASLCFLMGGVSPGEMLASYVITIATALLLGTIGLWWTTISRKTSASGALSYGSIFILLVGVPVYAAFIESLNSFYSTGGYQPARELAQIHYILMVCVFTLLIAIAGTLLVRWILVPFRRRLEGRGTWVLFGVIAVGLSLGVAAPLLSHNSWYPRDMSVVMAPNPFMVMVMVNNDFFGSGGPYPAGILSNYSWYWIGATLLYLALAVDLLALTVYQFDRSRAKS